MNRLNFFRTLMASIGAMKVGKVENIISDDHAIIATDVETALPWLNHGTFTLWIGPGDFNKSDILRAIDREFIVTGRNERGNLVAISTNPTYDTRTQQNGHLEIKLIEADDLRMFSEKKAIKVFSAVQENSDSKTSIYGKI